MKQLFLLTGLLMCLFSIPALAKSHKPMRSARDTTSNADLYTLVWHCTFTVTPDDKTVASCVTGKFRGARKFIPVPANKERRAISDRVVKFLTGMYGYETYPYTDADSKKPVARPERCTFELTHGETAESDDGIVIRALSGTCPVIHPFERFLFQDRLLDGLNQIVYERGESPGGLAENNDD